MNTTATTDSLAFQIQLLMRAVKRSDIERNTWRARGGFGQTITGNILRFISDGPKPSSLIAAEVGIATTVVSALLAHHVKSGRVIVLDGASGRKEWALNPDFDEALDEEIRAAARLLRKHGYSVQKGCSA